MTRGADPETLYLRAIMPPRALQVKIVNGQGQNDLEQTEVSRQQVLALRKTHDTGAGERTGCWC